MEMQLMGDEQPMDFYSLFLIALALSLDAFGVALCIGLNKGVALKVKAMTAASFGFFQFLFSIIGAFAGLIFTRYVTNVPSLIGGAVVACVGLLMLKEGREEKGECLILRLGIIIILGISVSIDALVIGFTVLSSIKSVSTIFIYTLFIGLVSVVMTCFAFYISKHLHKIQAVSKYADYIGGVILVLFGIKMMIG